MMAEDETLRELLSKFKDKRRLQKKSVQTKFTRSLNTISPNEKIGKINNTAKKKFRKF
ncbi:hypothetical protein LCGC14_1554530 [marine sediment metagenome]|uniref:Uncharacterized protein n=1 Tax=marine sediment metagenome TaxID=412755 RepID=A0A0F9JAB0_9ZZZZ